jgi:hypothetical protein
MQQQRSKIKAFFLNVIPGAGHYYMGKRAQGIVYFLISFGVLLLSIFSAMVEGDDAILVMGLIGFLLLGILSMSHLVIKLLRMPASVLAPDKSELDSSSSKPVKTEDNERLHVILLSFIPGLGHFHMGLMQRGLSFLISFFGFMTVLLFLAGITSSDSFLLLFGVLPVIWLYCMFDAVQLIHRKQAGETLVDRTLFEEMEAGREEGRRSKVLATLLSAFPGAGQMYLGLQKRGLQLMLLFLGSIYVMDLLRLTLLFFLIPVIWFYSLFDGLQLVSRHGREPLQDRPVIEGFLNHQGWLGAALMCLGLYYIFANALVPAIDIRFPQWQIGEIVNRYFRTIIVSVILIGGGIKLMAGSKNSKARKGMGRQS